MKALFFLGALFVPALARHSLDDAADIQARRLADLERMLKGSQELPASFAHHGMPDLSAQAALAISSTDDASGGGGHACDQALPLTLSAPVTMSTTGAPALGSLGGRLPSRCGGASHPESLGVWFRLPAMGKGAYYATTCGRETGFDTQVTVVEGSCAQGFRCAADGDDDSYCGSSKRQSTVSFQAEAGKTYYVIVHGYRDRAGEFTLLAGKVGARADVAEVQKKHNTEKYRAEDGSPLRSTLVVRRGVMVDVSVTSAHALAAFKLRLPGSAEPSDGVREIEIPAISPLDRKLGYTFSEYWAVPVGTSGHTVTWRIWLPDRSSVGIFWLRAEFVNGLSVYLEQDVAVILNPFSKYDDVYLEGAAPRAEYLMNEHGLLYRGTTAARYAVPWAYDQFNLINLVTTLNLLTGATLAQRRSAVFLSRQLSQMINAADGKGMLSGKWPSAAAAGSAEETDMYPGGTNPNEWESTTDLSEKYTFDGGRQRVDKPVKYAQCWVFAGALTTSLRTIGMPARPVTNYDSPHEKRPYDGVIELFHRQVNDVWVIDKERTKDSVWSFHVWVEAWFKRTDVANGAADGWQIVDATPQDSSSGPTEPPFLHPLKMSGPAPLTMVNAGRRQSAFDTDFVFSEVNGVLREHFLLPSGQWIVNPDKPHAFGNKILTKVPDALCETEARAADGKNYARACDTDLRASGHYVRTSVTAARSQGASELLLQLNNNNNNNNNDNNNDPAPAATAAPETIAAPVDPGTGTETVTFVEDPEDKALAATTANKHSSPKATEVAPSTETAVDAERQDEAKETVEASEKPAGDAEPKADDQHVESSLSKGELATKAEAKPPAEPESRREADGLTFSFVAPDVVAAGKPLKVSLTTSGGRAERGTIAITVDAIDYRGESLGQIKMLKAPISANSGAGANGGGAPELSLLIPQTEYLPFLRESETMRVTFSGVVANAAPFVAVRTVLLLAPDVVLACPESPVAIGDTVACRASFTNPLNVPLTNVVVTHHFSGHGAEARGTAPVTVAPGASHTATVSVSARNPGPHAMLVTVMSRELSDLEASKSVQVGPEDPDTAVAAEAGSESGGSGPIDSSPSGGAAATDHGVLTHDLRAAEHQREPPRQNPEAAEEAAAAGGTAQPAEQLTGETAQQAGGSGQPTTEHIAEVETITPK